MGHGSGSICKKTAGVRAARLRLQQWASVGVGRSGHFGRAGDSGPKTVTGEEGPRRGQGWTECCIPCISSNLRMATDRSVGN